jgi:hypothetical protein
MISLTEIESKTDEFHFNFVVTYDASTFTTNEIVEELELIFSIISDTLNILTFEIDAFTIGSEEDLFSNKTWESDARQYFTNFVWTGTEEEIIATNLLTFTRTANPKGNYKLSI